MRKYLIRLYACADPDLHLLPVYFDYLKFKVRLRKIVRRKLRSIVAGDGMQYWFERWKYSGERKRQKLIKKPIAFLRDRSNLSEEYLWTLHKAVRSTDHRHTQGLE